MSKKTGITDQQNKPIAKGITQMPKEQHRSLQKLLDRIKREEDNNRFIDISQ